MKRIHLFFFILFISIYSCKQNNTNKKLINIKSNIDSQDTLTVSEIYLKKTTNLLRDLPYNEYNKGDYSKGYKKNNNSILTELLYQMPTKEKYISYSIRESENLNNLTDYTMIYDKNNNLVVTVITPYFKELINEGYNIKEGKKDTVFFKKGKIYFWRNDKASNKEILAKEKEILLVKREIDSILNI